MTTIIKNWNKNDGRLNYFYSAGENKHAACLFRISHCHDKSKNFTT